jgi:CubicO group peptidase (beta-lactamase class C family)
MNQCRKASFVAFSLTITLLIPCAIILALCGCTGGSDAPPAPYANTITQMTAAIESAMAETNVTGLSIALVDGQNVVWSRGFGYADKEANVPAAADTIYEIGSLSKTFAATAVMRLVEEGRMDIDQPLTRYLPGFSINQRFPASGPITIRSILTHHSGIPGDLFNGAFTEGQPFDYDTWLLDTLRNEYTSAPVGSVLAYSNSAIALLRRVIGAVAPGGFTAYTNDLFDRIGMRATSYELDDRIPREKLASAYSSGVKLPLLYGNLSTAGTIRSSVADMARYIKMINAGGAASGGQVVGRASLDEMFTRQNGNAPLDFDQQIGLTWFLGRPDYYAGRKIEHEGATAWFHAQIQILLDHQLGVIVLSNTMDADVAAVAAKTLEYALKEKKGIEPPPAVSPVYSPPDLSWTQVRLQALAGIYVKNISGLSFGTVTVEAVTGGLRVQGQTDIWIPRQNGYFSYPGTGPDSQRVQFKFQSVAGRSIVSVRYQGEEFLHMERYEQGAIPAAWTARRGAYAAVNINPGSTLWPGTNTMTLEVGADGFLRLKGTLRGDVPIKTITDTLAIVGGIGRNRGESVRVVTVGGEEQIEFWGYRYRRTLQTMNTFEGGTLFQTTSAGGSGAFNVLSLNGDWRQMGRQYGSLMKTQMSEFYDLAAARLVARGMTAEDLRQLGQYLYDLQFSYGRQLIDGMAETSGMSNEKQRTVAALMGGLFGCSSMDAWGDYSGGGPLVVGRNWDTARGPFDGYGRFLTTVVYNPPSPQNSVADINYVGSISMQTGLNSKGIFLDLQNGASSDPLRYADRTPAEFRLLSFLLDSSTAEQIDASFRTVSPSMGLIINAAAGNRLAPLASASVYEWATYGVQNRRGGGLLASSNHYTDPAWTGLPAIDDGLAGGFSKERLENLLTRGEEYKGQIDAVRMMQIFDTTIPNGGPTFPDDSSLVTNYQIVATPGDSTLWLKARSYSGWERMDLKPLFLR